jgi:GWxTD domain-containing protein
MRKGVYMRLQQERVAAWAALMMFLAALPAAAQSVKNLPERHRDWLQKDVVYIITDEEKQLFLRLKSDPDRDRFIEQFWLARDPTPGTPRNEYKEEHYKRMEYANAHFGGEWASDGWRTDRGKIWIILGPPQTRNFHTSGGQIYPIEVWFYGGKDEPALPPFFYVMFYQKEGMSDYRLYSPYVDGPEKLVRASGIENSPRNAYRFLRTYNSELARISLSLIPSEPADIDSPVSLASDTMLMKIVNLANDKFHKQKILTSRRLQEEVTTRLVRDPSLLQATALPLRDNEGRDYIHYALQLAEPSDYTLTRYKDQYYLSMEARIRVLDASKSLVYETTREAVRYFAEKELDDARSRPFSFEDRLPAWPGRYTLEFGLLNRSTRSYYKATAQVEIESQPVSDLAVGRPVLIQNCAPASRPDEPFAISGSKCTILARQEVERSLNATVNIMFPVYIPAPKAGVALEPLKVQYKLGRLDRSVEPVVVEDSLDPRRATRFGAILVGKSIPAKTLAEGSYLLSIHVTDPVTGKVAGTTLPVRLGGSPMASPNTMVPDGASSDSRNGNEDYWRGLCANSSGNREQAKSLLRRALELNEKHIAARAQLSAILFDSGDFASVLSLWQGDELANVQDPDTLRRVVLSLANTGRLDLALKTAEDGFRRLEPNAPLLDDVAGLYEKSGKRDRARELREQARRIEVQKKAQN